MFWLHDILSIPFDVMTCFNDLTFFPIICYDVLFNGMIYFLTWWRTFWCHEAFWRHNILYEILFVHHIYISYLFDVMTNSLTLWHTFLHFDVMTLWSFLGYAKLQNIIPRKHHASMHGMSSAAIIGSNYVRYDAETSPYQQYGTVFACSNERLIGKPVDIMTYCPYLLTSWRTFWRHKDKYC